MDANLNGIPDECECPPVDPPPMEQIGDPATGTIDLRKLRALAIDPGSYTGDFPFDNHAFRVTFVSLPPNRSPYPENRYPTVTGTAC